MERELFDNLKTACQAASHAGGMKAGSRAITAEGLDSLVQASVSPMMILTLLFQYGPQVLQLLISVISDLKAGSFSWATWQAEFAKYGNDVMDLVKKIIASLGIVVPPAVDVP